MYKNRRDNNRIEVGIDVTYILADGSEVRVCRTVDVSPGGMAIYADQIFHAKTPLKFYFNTKPKEVFDCEVVWCHKIPVVAGDIPKPCEYKVGLKYGDAILERVSEILNEIEARK
jgi:c-di-GMP-binding flagellar brake protein YcgR